MMWIRKYLCAFFFALCLFLPVSECTASSQTSLDMVPKEMVIKILDDWSASNEKLLTMLSESESELTTASTELIILKKELAEQKVQLAGLKMELLAAQNDCKNAEQSLLRANEELKVIATDLKTLEKKKSRAENQRTFWQIIAAIATGVAIAR